MWQTKRQHISMTKNIKVLWNVMCFIWWNICNHEDIYNRECHIKINININIIILSMLIWDTTYIFYEFVNFLWISMLIYPRYGSAFLWHGCHRHCRKRTTRSNILLYVRYIRAYKFTELSLIIYDIEFCEKWRSQSVAEECFEFEAYLVTVTNMYSTWIDVRRTS